MLSNYEVFKLLTDLKEQRKDSGKNKHSAGQQNLNTIMYETLKYLSKTPSSRQTPEIVKEFLTAMMPHKLTKWWRRVRSGYQRSRSRSSYRWLQTSYLVTRSRRTLLQQRQRWNSHDTDTTWRWRTGVKACTTTELDWLL
ncbi:DNA-directed RNA polymerase III subunit RPC9 isoform X3 [Pungitius pungitius]|nr:DNA-directed RNA polymerase III subunit RPC9 isoform X3 [Pungitius pungitius]